MIPEAAVEAAAESLYVAEHGPWISGGSIATGGTPWGTSREARERDKYLARAHAALEAAAEHLLAEADNREVAAPHMLTRVTNSVINRAYEDGRVAGLKEASAPHMLALVWDAGERAGVDAMHGQIRPNPYRS